MSANSLSEQLNALVGEGRKTILTLNPSIERMPLPIRRYDDPFLPFGKAVISATRDLVCGYLFHVADYLALGAAGAVAIERTIAYAGSDVVCILHGPFAEVTFNRLLDATAFNAQLLTLSNQSPELQLIDGDQNVRGEYLPHTNTMRIEDYLLAVTGDEVLYSDFSEDFASHIRENLKVFNDKHAS